MNIENGCWGRYHPGDEVDRRLFDAAFLCLSEVNRVAWMWNLGGRGRDGDGGCTYRGGGEEGGNGYGGGEPVTFSVAGAERGWWRIVCSPCLRLFIQVDRQ